VGAGPLDESSPLVDDSHLAQLVRDLADAVVIADADGTIVFWNTGATTLFGWSGDEAVGQSLDLIIPDRLRGRHWDGYRRVMQTGETDYAGRLLEVPALHRDGRRLSVAFTVSLLPRPGETRPAGIAAVLRDDTERFQERRRFRELSAQVAASTSDSTTES
jgi:PAS domain S-box-containing protein